MNMIKKITDPIKRFFGSDLLKTVGAAAGVDVLWKIFGEIFKKQADVILEEMRTRGPLYAKILTEFPAAAYPRFHKTVRRYQKAGKGGKHEHALLKLPPESLGDVIGIWEFCTKAQTDAGIDFILKNPVEDFLVLVWLKLVELWKVQAFVDFRARVDVFGSDLILGTAGELATLLRRDRVSSQVAVREGGRRFGVWGVRLAEFRNQHGLHWVGSPVNVAKAKRIAASVGRRWAELRDF
jgi:hypothetical protein